jgi:hypothetical protein
MEQFFLYFFRLSVRFGFMPKRNSPISVGYLCVPVLTVLLIKTYPLRWPLRIEK